MFIKFNKSFTKVLLRKSFPIRTSQLMSSASSTSPVSEVLFEESTRAGVITLNRPKALNALNLNMIRLIYPKLKEWEKSKSVVIIKGAGEKAFCAGGDVVSVTESGKQGGTLPKEFFKEEYF